MGVYLGGGSVCVCVCVCVINESLAVFFPSKHQSGEHVIAEEVGQG